MSTLIEITDSEQLAAFSEELQELTKDWDIEAMIKAAIKDDPEMAEHENDLWEAFNAAKAGKIGRVTQIQSSPNKQD